MENLHLEPFLQSPEIHFEADTDTLSIVGKSYPEDALGFYEPIIKWCKEYVSTNPKVATLTCEVEYLNSSSQKMLLDLLLSLKPIVDAGNELNVVWRYEEGDDDIQSVGESIANELDIDFNYEEF